MLQRDLITKMFSAVLGRSPAPSEVQNCQTALRSVHALVEALIASDEFKSHAYHVAAARARSEASGPGAPQWRKEPVDIDWAYRKLLGRAPENYAAVANWLLSQPSKEQIIEAFIASDEFKSNAWHTAAADIRNQYRQTTAAA